MSERKRLGWFDLVRGLSALAVCASHLRAAMFVKFADVPSPNLALKAFYFATGLGHQAVVVFFVLSGFFVGGAVLARGAGFRWSDYALARLARLWVVLLPALVLTAVADRIIEAHDPQVFAGAFRSVWNSGPTAAEGDPRGMLVFLGNLAFLQTILVPVYGSNSPLWSLANEFWYYLAFPLCAFAVGWCGSRARRGWRVAAAAVAIAILVWLPSEIVTRFPVWLFGVVVWLVARRLVRIRLALLIVGAISFLAALVLSELPAFQAMHSAIPDIIVGVAFSILACAVADSSNDGFGSRTLLPVGRVLSEISYSLYVIHFPLVIVLATVVFHGRQRPPSVALVAEYLGWLAALLVVAGAFWWLFEKRTDAVRAALTPLVRRFQPRRES